MSGTGIKKVLLAVVLSLSASSFSSAQFLEDFEQPLSAEWRTATGDGDAVSRIEIEDGYSSIIVDATSDQRNVWWAIMQATLSQELDLEQLEQPGYEVRVEARIRSSHAPRRVNLHVNTQRTVDFHTHLMEFDIPDTSGWHTISMTTSGFDGKPGDTVNAHIALMDWGFEIYRVDVGYFKVDVVNASEAPEDHGDQVLYPPPLAEPDQFALSKPVLEVGMIDQLYPDVNYSGWVAGDSPVFTTDGTKTILLRWDLSELQGRKVLDYGMLELTTHSYLQATDTGLFEFDKVRLVEILNGNPEWNRDEVTFNNFTEGKPFNSIINQQMIIDINIPTVRESILRIHIPRPVIQRMIDGQTKGIAMFPLGALHASFYFEKDGGNNFRPKLYMNLDN